MRRVMHVLLAAVVLLAVACGKPAAPDPNEVAGRAAKAYYDYLLHGKYAAYVDGFYRPDSIPPSYREQLIVSAKQYVFQLRQDHGGLKAVAVAGARADTARHTGHAFLSLCFGDSTREQIVVPLVLHNGNWMLR